MAFWAVQTRDKTHHLPKESMSVSILGVMEWHEITLTVTWFGYDKGAPYVEVRLKDKPAATATLRIRPSSHTLSIKDCSEAFKEQLQTVLGCTFVDQST